MENLGFVYSRVVELAVTVNNLNGTRKFKYDEIKPNVRNLRVFIERLKEEFLTAEFNFPLAVLDELDLLEGVLDNEEQKRKAASAKQEGSEPGERE